MRLERKVAIGCLHPMSWGQLTDLPGQFRATAMPTNVLDQRVGEHDIEAGIHARLCQGITRLTRVTCYRDDPVVVRLAGFAQIEHGDMAGPDRGAAPSFDGAAEIHEAQVLYRGKCFCGTYPSVASAPWRSETLMIPQAGVVTRWRHYVPFH